MVEHWTVLHASGHVHQPQTLTGIGFELHGSGRIASLLFEWYKFACRHQTHMELMYQPSGNELACHPVTRGVALWLQPYRNYYDYHI